MNIKLEDLKACALFTAVNDVRFYLGGVFLGRGIVSATNGHCALICNEVNATEELIIPLVNIKCFIQKLGRSRKGLTVNVEKLNEYWCMSCDGVIEVFNPIDGIFPNIQKIDIGKPTEYHGDAFPIFDIKYLMLFNKVATIYKQINAVILPTNQTGRAYIKITDDVHGLLMPCRI